MLNLEAELFKVLGVATRLRIIDLLKQKGALGAKEIADSLGISVSAASQHLKVLKHAGLVRNERKGYWIPYEIKPDALEQCGELLSRVCRCGCQGPARRPEAELDQTKDMLIVLQKREQELQKELEKTQRQIQELEKA